MSNLQPQPLNRDLMNSLFSVHKAIDAQAPDKSIENLVVLRASQINRCSHCIHMHTAEAQQQGETGERLNQLFDWQNSTLFDHREKAALAWTEALTLLKPDTNLDELRSDLRKHFMDTEIAILSASIAMINLWNRIRISGH